MIGQDQLAESARYMDALSEEHGFDGWAKMSGIDAEGLNYVASQRALRAAMLLDGQDPRKLSRTRKTKVKLSQTIQDLLPALTALSMDGLAIGIDAGKKASRQQ
jgi:hypothetical protein